MLRLSHTVYVPPNCWVRPLTCAMITENKLFFVLLCHLLSRTPTPITSQNLFKSYFGMVNGYSYDMHVMDDTGTQLYSSFQ